MVKVSVIVPVYNPGPNIDDCVRSLREQSLPADEYEVIYVDDGSTDETPARLDALAAEHDNVHVAHIENSGWPGRPRNVGMDMAQGEFVYFVDNDDWVGPEALERLYDRATAEDADIVIGKVVGAGKSVPRGLFRANRSNVPLDWTPMLRLLTPHKLFRRAFLVEHAIRFPEGRRRLEDHVFVMHAYFHARGICVLADYPCYHWVLRADKVNASFQPFDPAGYFDNVREVLDLIAEHTEPGPLRDELQSHWYRGKMLQRVGGKAFVNREPDYRRRLYEEIRGLALERYTPEMVAPHLQFALRVRSRLLRDGHYDALMDLARFESGLKVTATVRDVRARRRGLRLHLEVTLDGAKDPLRFVRRGDRVLWEPPEPLRPLVPEDMRDVTEEMRGVHIQVLLRSREDQSEYALPTKLDTRLEPDGDALRPVLRVEARLDPRRAAAGAPLPAGDWEIRIVPMIVGFNAAGPARRRASTPLVLSAASTGGQVIERGGRRRQRPSVPPTLRGRLARRAPWLVRLVRGAGAGAAGSRR